MGLSTMEKVTQQIVQQIEEAIQNGGGAPWVRPWNGFKDARNYLTQKPYRGINILLLEPGEYLTFKQIKQLQQHNKDIKLRKGSKGHLCVFFNFLEKEEEKERADGEIEMKKKKIPMLKQYTLFNIADIDNLPPISIVETYNTRPIEEVDQLLENYFERECIDFERKFQNRAYYVPAFDYIVVPTIEQFELAEEYYSTVFHESVHSTGHESRLNRLDESSFGSDPYAKEELVAEIGACFLARELELSVPASEMNSVAYLSGWLSKIKNDTSLILTAANQAQKAVDLILNRQFENNKEEEK